MADNASEPKPLDQKTEAELKREAKARLRRLSPIAAATVVEETVRGSVSKPANGFVTFLREKAIVGLAIGFVVGTQVQGIVKSFIADFINPFVALVFPGNAELSARKWSIYGADFKWGDMVFQLIDFLFIIFVIYFVIRLFKLDRLDKKGD